jgi:hypothetical protein
MRGKKPLVGSAPARSSITALWFGVATAHYGLEYEVAISSGVGCDFGVDTVYVIGAVELGSDMKLPCEEDV